MSSRQTENVHLNLLNKLLADSGLECLRPLPESLEPSVSSGDSEIIGPVEIKVESPVEVVPEEEEKVEIVEEKHEEIPEIFPTPSLRRVLPDRVRIIEEQNRIHVLPEEFKTDIDPQAIPRIEMTAQQKYIEILAGLVGCTKYKSSLAEYWFLDTLANLLRRAQEDNLHRPTQAVLILWFCEWMKEMQHFDAASRPRMLRRWQDNMLAAAKFIAENEHIPTPAQIGVYYRAPEELGDGDNRIASAKNSKHLVTFEGAAYECSLMDLTKIIHYIYDLTDYQYDLVRSVFTHTPEYILFDAPYQMMNPKKIYTPLKAKAKKESGKKSDAKPTPPKGKKGGKEPAIPDNPDYIALMELKAREERLLDEQEEVEREAWNLKSHILPLSFAVDEEFFNKYWPPPPPPPEPEPVEEKGKGKGKDKKK